MNLFGDPNARLRYGDRYDGEMASEAGFRRFARDVGLVDAEAGLLYQSGDLDMLTGLDFGNRYTRLNWNNLFPGGNSYFVPDRMEVDPYLYSYHTPAAQDQVQFGGPGARQRQDTLFNQLYAGQRLGNETQGSAWGASSDMESLTRQLLRHRGEGGGEVEMAYGNPYYEARGVLGGMDVARGDLTAEQGQAVAGLPELQREIGSLERDVSNTTSHLQLLQKDLANLKPQDPINRVEGWFETQKASLEAQISQAQNRLSRSQSLLDERRQGFDGSVVKLNAIAPDASLSSIELINSLRTATPEPVQPGLNQTQNSRDNLQAAPRTLTAEQNGAIFEAFRQHANNPALIHQLANANNVTAQEIAQALGQPLDVVNRYFSQAGLTLGQPGLNQTENSRVGEILGRTNRALGNAFNIAQTNYNNRDNLQAAQNLAAQNIGGTANNTSGTTGTGGNLGLSPAPSPFSPAPTQPSAPQAPRAPANFGMSQPTFQSAMNAVMPQQQPSRHNAEINRVLAMRNTPWQAPQPQNWWQQGMNRPTGLL